MELVLNDPNLLFCGLNDPNLLFCGQKLLELSCTKVNGGGYSTISKRERVIQSNCRVIAHPPKPPKSSESLRMKHIKELEEDIKDLSDQLKYKV